MEEEKKSTFKKKNNYYVKQTEAEACCFQDSLINLFIFI